MTIMEKRLMTDLTHPRSNDTLTPLESTLLSAYWVRSLWLRL
jgi:hypothetical protein